jgi:hypothetical protein
MNPTTPRQLEHEIWLKLDGQRVLARLRAAGPSWMHVFIEGEIPSDAHVPFTVVLRGAEGGVIDGLGYTMSTRDRDDRTVLHLRIIELTTGGCPSVLRRFAHDVLNDADSPFVTKLTSASPRPASSSTVGARHDSYGSRPLAQSAVVPEDSVVVSKGLLWRSDSLTSPAQLVRSSQRGRRLLVRLNGPVPTAWESVKLELDMGSCGEPRPIQLVGMVLGTVESKRTGVCHVSVRLVRWSDAADRAVWMRWVNHQQRLNTVLNESNQSAALSTRTIRPHRVSGPLT